jgi:hypothetical protein
MGIKSWLARNTSNPSQYADTFTSGLMELIEYLAASLVAFSGQQPTNETDGRHQVVFQDHFEMEMAGFLPATKDVILLVEPSVADMQGAELFRSAYRDAAVFLSLYSDNAARSNLRPENAEMFVKVLHVSVAKRCAGKFGFDPEPRNAFVAIQELIPIFLCKIMLNEGSYGVDDGLGNILQHLSLSCDGQTRYAFVAGSKQQPVGCAASYLRVLTNITESVRRCAHDLRW